MIQYQPIHLFLHVDVGFVILKSLQNDFRLGVWRDLILKFVQLSIIKNVETYLLHYYNSTK